MFFKKKKKMGHGFKVKMAHGLRAGMGSSPLAQVCSRGAGRDAGRGPKLAPHTDTGELGDFIAVTQQACLTSFTTRK